MSLTDTERLTQGDQEEDILADSLLRQGYEIHEEKGPDGEVWRVFVEANKDIFSTTVRVDSTDSQPAPPAKGTDDIDHFVMSASPRL